MPSSSQDDNTRFPLLKRIQQSTNSHCGPAVLEMLTGYIGKDIPQQRYVDILNIGEKLKTHGMTVAEMGEALKLLDPTLRLWYKQNSRIEDIYRLNTDYNYPVGIEWQGIFYQYSDGDDGHYSVVTGLDLTSLKIYIADPYEVFAGKDRTIKLGRFIPRWWETNEIIDPVSNKKNIVEDIRMMFIVTHAHEDFPLKLNMVAHPVEDTQPVQLSNEADTAQVI